MPTTCICERWNTSRRCFVCEQCSYNPMRGGTITRVVVGFGAINFLFTHVEKWAGVCGAEAVHPRSRCVTALSV